MGRYDIKGLFKGRQAWKTANLLLFLIVYGMILIIPMYFPQYALATFGIIGVIGSFYFNIYQYKIRNVEKNAKGVRDVEGWTTHGYKNGERHIFEDVKFETKDKLSPADLIETQRFIDIQAEHSKTLETKTGLERFSQMQLSYNETIKEEKMDDIERGRYKEKIKGDHKKSMDEYNIMIEQKLIKKNNQKNNVGEEETNNE